MPFPELEEAAIAWGARVIPAMHARGELGEIVRDQLVRPERVERYVANLSGPARNAWARLKMAGGRVPLDELIAPRDVPLAARRRILRELATPLLAWHSYTASAEGEQLREVVVPSAILSPGAAQRPSRPSWQRWTTRMSSSRSGCSPIQARWDLLTLLREVVSVRPRWRALAEGDPGAGAAR